MNNSNKQLTKAEDNYKTFTNVINILNNLSDSIIEQYNLAEEKPLVINHIISAISNNEDYYSIIDKIINNIQPTSSLDEKTIISILNNIQKLKEM